VHDVALCHWYSAALRGRHIFTVLGYAVLGIAIAYGNVLLLGLTRRNFALRTGFITSLYSSVIALGASLAAGISFPLADIYNLD